MQVCPMHIMSPWLLTSWLLGGREKEKAKMIPVNWISPLRLLKCLEGGKVETIDLLDDLSTIFI